MVWTVSVALRRVRGSKDRVQVLITGVPPALTVTPYIKLGTAGGIFLLAESTYLFRSRFFGYKHKLRSSFRRRDVWFGVLD